MSEDMGHRRKVPEDLMGTILGEGWEGHPERVGITFNLSKQVSTELDKLRLELELEGNIRSSKSEITEVALRIAVEDVRGRGKESELVKRLTGRQAAQATGATDEGRLTVRRSVGEAGFIVETTYEENAEFVDEDVVASVAELPVECGLRRSVTPDCDRRSLKALVGRSPGAFSGPGRLRSRRPSYL